LVVVVVVVVVDKLPCPPSVVVIAWRSDTSTLWFFFFGPSPTHLPFGGITHPFNWFLLNLLIGLTNSDVEKRV
jgi:hypothetical protein